VDSGGVLEPLGRRNSDARRACGSVVNLATFLLIRRHVFHMLDVNSGNNPAHFGPCTRNFSSQGDGMACHSCHSENLKVFVSETSIYLSSSGGAYRSMTVRPKWIMCVDCGSAVLRLPKEQLELLLDNDSNEVQKAE